jgi:hypothetical protein
LASYSAHGCNNQTFTAPFAANMTLIRRKARPKNLRRMVQAISVEENCDG